MRYKRSFSKNFSITLQNKKFNFKQPKIQQLKMHSIKIERLSPIGIESINNSLHLNLSKVQGNSEKETNSLYKIKVYLVL